MSEPARRTSIRCPIGLYPGQETEIIRLTQEINRASTPSDKAFSAEALIKAVDTLLACEQYDGDSLGCHLCHNFSTLRRKAAALIIGASYLNP
jgi:hypothetical protein